MKQTAWRVSGGFVVLFVLALTLTAGEPGLPKDGPSPVEVVAHFLELSQGQVEQFVTLLGRREEAMRGILEQIRPRQQQLEILLSSEEPDRLAVGILLVEIHRLQQGIRQTQGNFLRAFGDLLDPEQRGRASAVEQASRLAPVVGAFARLGLLAPPEPRGARGEERALE